MVEHAAVNRDVEGSSPSSGANPSHGKIRPKVRRCILHASEQDMKILQMPRRFKTTHRLSSAKLVFRADAEFFPNGSQHDVGGAFNVDFAGVDYQVVI